MLSRFAIPARKCFQHPSVSVAFVKRFVATEPTNVTEITVMDRLDVWTKATLKVDGETTLFMPLLISSTW